MEIKNFQAGQPIAWHDGIGEIRGVVQRLNPEHDSLSVLIGGVIWDRAPMDRNPRIITERELAERWWDTGKPVERGPGEWLVMVEEQQSSGQWEPVDGIWTGEPYLVDGSAQDCLAQVERDVREVGPGRSWRVSVWPESPTLLGPYGQLFYMQANAPAARAEHTV